MEIKTKFNLGDEIYYITNYGIRHSDIVGFSLVLANVVRSENGYMFDYSIEIEYETSTHDEINERHCFGSKQELIESLIK